MKKVTILFMIIYFSCPRVDYIPVRKQILRFACRHLYSLSKIYIFVFLKHCILAHCVIYQKTMGIGTRWLSRGFLASQQSSWHFSNLPSVIKIVVMCWLPHWEKLIMISSFITLLCAQVCVCVCRVHLVILIMIDIIV